MDVVAEYRRAREDFFARHGARWPGTLTDPFDILAPYPLDSDEIEQIRTATAALFRVYQGAASFIGELPDDALFRLGIPKRLLRAIRTSIPGLADCVWGRFDFARTAQGYRMLEFNVDVPGLVVEAFSINSVVCRDCGREDPNAGAEALLQATLLREVSVASRWILDADTAHVAVTSSGRHRQDQGIARYLTALLGAIGALYVPVESIRASSSGLSDPDGRRIDVLIRVFPMHLMRVRALDSDGSLETEDTADALIGRLVADRRLALINPPMSYALESKALQAVLWALAGSDDVLDGDDREAIRRYMLPTFLTPPDAGAPYAMKPFYGSEGDSVGIASTDGELIRGPGTTFEDAPKVYQQYVELPHSEMLTEYGPAQLHAVISCFALSGAPAGICMRAGSRITDGTAWVVPVCRAEEPRGKPIPALAPSPA
jgi:glutathionylspermidine synthase